MCQEFDEAFWDARYAAHDGEWGGDPNPQLAAEASKLAPGNALDAACGEGMDAIWLAARGWTVTAVELSNVAIERNKTADVPRDVARRIDWVHADLTVWTPSPAAYDLVSAQFIQMPAEPREIIFRKLAAAVKPGGTLLIVGHDPSDLVIHPNLRRPRPDCFYTASEVASLLEPSTWDIVVAAARERAMTDATGAPITVRDTVLRAHRRVRE